MSVGQDEAMRAKIAAAFGKAQRDAGIPIIHSDFPVFALAYRAGQSALASQQVPDDFTLHLICNAYEKGYGDGIGNTDNGKDLRAMYPEACTEQRAYIHGYESGFENRWPEPAAPAADREGA